MKTKILADFQICINVPLTSTKSVICQIDANCSPFQALNMLPFHMRLERLKIIYHSLISISLKYYFKGTNMQIEKAPINDRLCFKSILKISPFNCLYFCSNLPVKFAILNKSSLLFNSLYCLFC